eukprot:2318405-Ditylum_brightwellii.AAC.1
MQFYFQNINGSLKKGGWGKYEYTLKRVKELEIEIIGLVETNMPWTPNKISIARKKLGEEFNGRCKLQLLASKEPVASNYQPGGTLTAVGGRHSGRVLEAGEDKHGFGQWSWITVGGGKTNLYVITVYKVQQNYQKAHQ